MLSGFIDGVSRTGIHGWVRNMAHPAASISVVVTANNRLLGRTVANRHRPDLVAAGFGTGNFGFDIVFDPPLSPARSWLLHIRSDSNAEDMPGSPVRLQASTEFDGAARRAFAAALDGFADEGDLDERIAFLAGEQERLLQKRADARSRRRERTLQRVDGPVLPPRALVIDQRVPEPERDGGSNALVSHMRSLVRLGYQVVFAAQSMAGGEAAAALEREGILCCHAPWYGSVEDVLRREAGTFDLVYLHRVAVASAYSALVRQAQPRARLVYSVADLHHIRLARQADVEERPELAIEAERSRAEEVWAASGADSVITHSTAEADLLRRAVPPEKVHVVTWSVPVHARRVAFGKRNGLALIGNFAHAPNAAAARHMRDEVMPLVQAADPSILCRLVGDGLPLSLQAPQAGLAYSGHVADLEDVFDAVRLTVAPLPYGAGLKGKVLASLAAGIPCVCSPVAAEGMELPARLAELVVPDAAAASRMIVRLHSDEGYNARLSKRCVAFAERAFSDAALDAAMRRVVGRPAGEDRLASAAD